MRLYADFHTHTKHSHGTGTVLQNVRAAQARGLSVVAISDHGPANWFGVGVDSLQVFSQIREEAAQAGSLVPEVRVLVGVEANIIGTNGLLDIPKEIQSQFDLVLAGLHTMVHPYSWWDFAQVALANALARVGEATRRKALVLNTDAVISAVYNNKIDIITHPGYRLPIDTAELAAACAKTDTALEINTSHSHMTPDYVRTVCEAGARLVVGSDAHQPERVGDLALGVKLLEQAGVSSEQVLNATPVTV